MKKLMSSYFLYIYRSIPPFLLFLKEFGVSEGLEGYRKLANLIALVPDQAELGAIYRTESSGKGKNTKRSFKAWMKGEHKLSRLTQLL